MTSAAPLGIPAKITVGDGKNLVLRSFGGPAKAPRLLLLHGFWRSGLSPRMRRLAHHFSDRFRPVALDMRGHGASEGIFCFGKKEVDDLSLVLDLLHRTDSSPVGMLGFSMGGTFLACALGSEPDRFPLVRTAATVSAPVDPCALKVPWWDVRITKGIRIPEIWRMPRFLPPQFVRNRPNPLLTLPQITDPSLLIVHSEGDWLVPEADARAYFDTAGCRKRYAQIPNRQRSHADALFLYAPEPTYALLDSWFEETLLP